jgi:hypothetical protein
MMLPLIDRVAFADGGGSASITMDSAVVSLFRR